MANCFRFWYIARDGGLLEPPTFRTCPEHHEWIGTLFAPNQSRNLCIFVPKSRLIILQFRGIAVVYNPLPYAHQRGTGLAPSIAWLWFLSTKNHQEATISHGSK